MEENYSISPVLVSVYNRIEHFKKCIESLRENYLAEQTHLFIAVDAPYQERDVNVNKEIIEYVKSINGFKNVTPFIREDNLGRRVNFSLAREEIFKKYDRLIISEDDNIFSKDFLSFVNKGLEFYKDNKDVFSISGYGYPIKVKSDYNKYFYFNNFFSGWGVGIWRDKWNSVNWNKDFIYKYIRSFLKNYPKVYKYNKTANHLVINLINMIKNDTIYGDSYLSLYQYLNKKYSVFPVVSRVRNVGHDGSGANCRKRKKNEVYTNQSIYIGESDHSFMQEIKEDVYVNGLLKKHFRMGLLKKIYVFIFLFFLNFGFFNKK